ncbi:MAG: hypothetical protein IPN60_19930 [Saprospiraceae bacterium]|nr:hypothetical protein [Candidatus Opimibacter skivensis]
MKSRLGVLSILISSALMTGSSVLAQGTVYSVLGGLTMSTQTVNGFEKDPFFRFHAVGYMESSSEISPNALYASLGYHTKGSAVNSPAYIDDIGNEHPQQSNSMEFHNLSLGFGVKQRKEVGANFLSYGFGVRGDFNLSTDFGSLYNGLEGTERNFTYGLDFFVGFEFPMSELISTTIEIGFSPDLSEQIYIPFQDTGYNYSNGQPVVIQESSIKNIVFEARAGFRFWRKVIYTD